MRMNAITVIFFCLICGIFANPITFNITLNTSEQDSNSTETLLVTQSLGNGTLDVQSSESESSESVESESSDDTSEESDSVESNETELLVETRDDSMGSEENVRKSWLGVFATVVRDNSVEDNSTEVKDHPKAVTEKQTIQPPTVKTLKQSSNTKVALVQKATAQTDSSSESTESTDNTGLVVTLTTDSSQSSSSESNETSSLASDSSQSSQSSEDSSDSDSREINLMKDCVNGTTSCESQEYFFQDIGDDANYSEDNLMVPDEDERELSLRR